MGAARPCGIVGDAMLTTLPVLATSALTPTETDIGVIAEGGALDLSSGPCPNDGAICTWLLDVTGNDVIAGLGGTIIPALLRVILVLILAWFVARLARVVITRIVTRAAEESRDALHALRRRTSTDRDPTTELTRAERERAEQRAKTMAAVTGSIAVFAIWSIAIIIALSGLGLDIGPLIASAGIIGIALGFGAQSLVRDFLSGMFMLLEDQYGVGDIVDLGEATGTVESVTLRVTRIRDVEGTVWHIPNGEIRRVGNFSQLWSRSLLDISVAYHTDLDQAARVVTEVANDLANDPEWAGDILEDPDLWGVDSLGENQITLRLVMKTRPARQWALKREFYRRLKAAFDREGIQIPFPQRVVWLHHASPPEAPKPAPGALPGPEGRGAPEPD